MHGQTGFHNPGLIIAISTLVVLLFVSQTSFTVAFGTSFGNSTDSDSLLNQTTSKIGPANSSQFIDESWSVAYDSLDPSYGFFTVDGYFPNVFQGLVDYNRTNENQVVPSLASSWSISKNLMTYNFTMRSNTWFSNKDPVNAYVAWFSFVRVLYYNAPTTVGISNFADLTVNTTTDEPCYNGAMVPGGCGANVLPHGLEDAVNFGFNLHADLGTQTGQNTVVEALNSMLSNFNPSNASQAKVMSYSRQAYVVISKSEFQINLIQPYKLFLLDLPSQWGALQDPNYIDVNGGVQNNSAVQCSLECQNFNNNGMPGTGPYVYDCPSKCPADHSELVLLNNTNYWARGVSGLPKQFQPAKINTIIMKFGLLASAQIADFDSNIVQLVTPPIADLKQAYNGYLYKSSYKFNQLFSNEGYPMCELALGINSQYDSNNFPGTNTQNYTQYAIVRQAIVHAVNYTEMQSKLFTDFKNQILGELYLPPVPPGFGTLDNPQNIPLYSFNITVASQLIAQAGNKYSFYVTLGNGTKVGDTSGTAFTTLDLDYITPETSQLKSVVNILNQGLNQLGLKVIGVGLTISQYDIDLASPSTTPQLAGVGWCADWTDPIYQQFYDMATVVAHQPNWVNNATLNTLLAKIPFETSSANQLAQTKQAYQIFTQLATIIQEPDPAIYYMHQPYVSGLTYSQLQFGIFYNMISYS